MATSRPDTHASAYHRERAESERRAATRAANARAREAHLELAMHHEMAQAIGWYRERFDIG